MLVYVNFRLLKLNLNGLKSEKSYKTKKLRIFTSFPTVYHLCDSDKWFKNTEENRDTDFILVPQGSMNQAIQQYSKAQPGSTEIEKREV